MMAKVSTAHIGRIGALAVTLGVGAAIATTPGIAFAEPSTTGDSKSSTGSSTNSVVDSSAVSTDGADSADSSDSDDGSVRDRDIDVDDATVDDIDLDDEDDGDDGDTDPAEGDDNGADSDSDDLAVDDLAADDLAADEVADDIEDVDPEVERSSEESDADNSAAEDKQDTSATGSASAQDGDSTGQRVSNRSASAFTVKLPDTSEDGDSPDAAAAEQPTSVVGAQSRLLRVVEVDDAPAEDSAAITQPDIAPMTPPAAAAAAVTSVLPAPARPRQQRPLVIIVSNLVSNLLAPLFANSPGTEPPLQRPVFLGVLALVRDEIERIRSRSNATVASQQATAQLAAATPGAAATAIPADENVLVIGIDGTRLNAILADPANVNLFALMAGGDIVVDGAVVATIEGGTTAASTITGHTTISLPSWTTILSGVWGETAGVINNVFYPQTAENFPTVFNTLEAQFGDNIQTMAIANWFGTASISDATSLGTPGADVVQYVPDDFFVDDPIWTQSDDYVAQLTVEAIEGTNMGCGGPCPVPDFLYSYFVGVDNTGHEFGGGSTQYELALRNVDENVGEIMEAVVNSGEEWTVIVVTDHGQSTERSIGAFAHGFQTPEETTTFVIGWDNANDFTPAAINNQYSIVDVSPTVLDLFGVVPPTYYQGVPLSDHDASTVVPTDPGTDDANLRLALQDAIAMYGFPDIGTNLALGTRTVFATIPMVLYDATNSLVQMVETIPLVGGLLAATVQVIGDALYVTTNIPARIVAQLTGVDTSIFPLLPPPVPAPPLAPPPPVTTAPSSPVTALQANAAALPAAAWARGA